MTKHLDVHTYMEYRHTYAHTDDLCSYVGRCIRMLLKNAKNERANQVSIYKWKVRKSESEK